MTARLLRRTGRESAGSMRAELQKQDVDGLAPKVADSPLKVTLPNPKVNELFLTPAFQVDVRHRKSSWRRAAATRCASSFARLIRFARVMRMNLARNDMRSSESIDTRCDWDNG